MPIAFAQVREDASLDLALLERMPGRELRGIMIASGGCTAAALAASGRFAELHLVDINPAQLALCRLKLHLLQTATPIERMEVLGHRALDAKYRAPKLAERLSTLNLQPDSLGRLPMVAKFGPDHAGRYELLFAQLRAEISAHQAEWSRVLTEEDPQNRLAQVAPETDLGRALDEAFDSVMAMPNLVQLFGAEATRNSRLPFARHFAQRTRAAIAQLPTRGNPYLWQMLLGRFPDEATYPWLTARPPARMPRIAESLGTMDSALSRCRGEFDFVHLSNILDWLSSEQAARTLELAHDAFRPGGHVIIRQLNSTLDIPSLAPRFDWLAESGGGRDAACAARAARAGVGPGAGGVRIALYLSAWPRPLVSH
jgi:S-adenosylmethionine-diacylglycerol 3-amino-3-carboxypropyl transferase